MSTHSVVVVGGGIAGLAAAWELRRSGADVAVHLVEAGDRLGGKIASERRQGFLVEGGPDSFVTRKPAAVELARELGLGDRLIDTDESQHRVYVVRGGRLVEIPPEMGSALPCRLAPVWGSELLSWRGKLRLALERFVPRRRARGDESLAAFLRRRFGREVLESFAGPILAGIYVSDPETLSLRSTFPQFADIERRHGSVARGLRAAHGGAPAPAARRVALEGGIGELADALLAALAAADETAPPVHLHTGRPATAMERTDAGWRVALDDGTPVTADAVVLALPAFAAAPLLRPLEPRLAATLEAIRYVSTATVSLGYRAADLPRPLEGFGFVVPAAEERRITACTFSSAKFPGRAPQGHALVRAFLGGPHGERWLQGSDADLIGHARAELADLLDLRADPVLTAVHRHPRGTPQYDVGHRDRVATLESTLPPAVHVAGSAYHGIGIPDCIKSGRKAATRALESLQSTGPRGTAPHPS